MQIPEVNRKIPLSLWILSAAANHHLAQSAVRSETGVEQNRGSEVIWTKLDDNNKTSQTHHIGLLPLQQAQWIFDRLIKCGGLAEAQGDVMPNSSYMPINL